MQSAALFLRMELEINTVENMSMRWKRHHRRFPAHRSRALFPIFLSNFKFDKSAYETFIEFFIGQKGTPKKNATKNSALDGP